jgi:mannose-1-phosphate guanylyltransferase
MEERMGGNLWAVILAAGEGARLASLTQKLYGTALPKQFAVLRGEASLLQETVQRTLALVPEERIVVVMPETYEDVGRAQLSTWKEIHAVVQPQNRGTGPGILLALAYVLEHDPDATVCICPSDHAFGDPVALTAALRRAARASRSFRIVALGIRATRPETEYGWMRVSRARGDVGTVLAFVEKPDADAADRLFEEGALWNTFLMVGSACAIWESAEARMPEHAEAIRACVPVMTKHGRSELAKAYARLDDRNFSREVLQREERLGVVELSDAAWSDLGSPERVYDALARTGELDVFEERLRAVG